MPTAKEIAERIKTEIDAYAITKYDDGHRNHLGASQIGNDCARACYFVFRWIKKPNFSGRMQRLFRRGHREELVFVEYLKGIGFKVQLYDPEYKLLYHPESSCYFVKPISEDVTDGLVENVTDVDEHILRASLAGIKLPQLRITDCDGHFGGSLDATLEFPESWGVPGVFLGEFKTKGTGAGFNKLVEKGVAIASPEHWAQMCTYGHKKNIEYAVYFTVNKNDDDIHIEVIKLDLGLGADMVRKAGIIIAAKSPPPRISETVTNFKCKWCDFKEECHSGKPIEKNCRSCHKATAVEDGRWHCGQWGALIPESAIKDGCQQWLGVI